LPIRLVRTAASSSSRAWNEARWSRA